MKKFLRIISLFVFSLAVLPKISHALVSDSIRSMANTNDRGDSGSYFSVSVGTTSAVVIYSTTTVSLSGTRSLEICNSEAFDLFIGTFSAVNATTSPREYIPQNWCQSVPFGFQLWAIFESAAGVAKAATGVIWFQSGQ